MEDFMVSIVSTPIGLTNKVNNLCEHELELLKKCKQNNVEYCFLFENLYNDCIKFKEKERKN
tara:strand:+ start:565 stop:750 length:186 start_codon:yes stop_codon:yes gene_type:complete